MMSREIVNEMNQLSMQAYGTKSRWRKILDYGMPELVTEETTEYVPSSDGEGEGTTRQIQVPVKLRSASGREMLQSTIKRPSADQVKEMMLKIIKQKEDFQEMLKNFQESQAKLKVEKEAQSEATLLAGTAAGSAI